MMEKIKLYEIYYSQIENPTFLDLIIFKLYKLNDCCLLRNKLQSVIYYFETIKYGENHSDKLIEHQSLNDLQIETNNAINNTATDFYITKPFEKYTLSLDNDLSLDCADTHLVYASNTIETKWCFVNELTTEHKVLTKCGWAGVKSVKNTHQYMYMCDISVQENTHSYYSNDILSHNTTTTIGIIIHRLLFTKQVTAMAVANKRSTSEEIMRKFKEVLKELPFFLKPGIVNLSMKKIRFDNGSILNTAAASKTPATGDSLQLLYIDECALIPSNIIDDYWASVYNTMNSFYNAQIIVTSTPRGKGNLYHKLWTNALNKVEGWNGKRVDWWEVPGHDDKWAEEKKKDLGDELFAQEMELSFETATSRLVTPWYIEFTTRLKQIFKPIQFYGVPKEVCDKILWAPDFHPDMLHKQYLKTHKFLLSIDTAKGIEKGSMGKRDSDYNVINIFSIELMSPIQIEKNRDNYKNIDIRNCVQYKQIGVYLDNKKDEEACAEAAKYITFNILKSGFEDIDDVRILLEMNYNGPNFLNRFKTHPDYYSQLIIKTPRGNINKAQHEIKYEPGFITVKGEWGKGYWCELGSKMMDDRQIIIRQYNDENPNEGSLNQIYNFGKNVNRNGQCKYEGSGVHDDIAVTSFFVSIAGEQNSFRQWLLELLEQQASFNYYKVRTISKMLDIYVDKAVTIDPAITAAFYRAASPKAQVHYESNGYGSLMRRQQTSTRYGNGLTYSSRNNRNGSSYYNNPQKYRQYSMNRYK